jgi:hypothetical protein
LNDSSVEDPWLHRYADLVAVCTALLFINGPAVSGNEARPLYSLGQSHMWLGAAVTILIAGLAVPLDGDQYPARYAGRPTGTPITIATRP